MAKKLPSKVSAAAQQRAASPSVPVPAGDLFTRTEAWLGRHAVAVFWSVFALSMLLTFGLFEMKIGLANDDALYMEAASHYSKDFFGYFYRATAPLYSMVLGVVVAVFGSNIVILKLFSVLFFAVSLYLIFRVFRGRIPYAVLFAALFITATNHLFLLHAVLTYTECFFAMVQMFFLWAVLRLIDKTENGEGIAVTWKAWLLYGAMAGVMYMSRNVATAAPAAVAAYFLWNRQWKNVVYALFFAVFFALVYESLKWMIWDLPFFSQFEDQGGKMLREKIFNPADPNNKPENLAGYFKRFWGNVEVYIGGRFWELLGLAKENGKLTAGGQLGLTLLGLALILQGVVFALLRKNKTVLLVSLYYAALCGATYFGIHTYWAQARFIMIYFPFIFITIFYGFYELFSTRALGGFKFFWFVVVLLFLLPNLFRSMGKVPANLKTLSRNAAGDEFYGYTPDWVNFFKASRWSARNLPEGSYVASRRAPMSFVYGDFKEFYGVYSLNSDDPDSLLARFKNNGVTHVLLAELRVQPNRYIPNRFINTLHRYVMTIAMKYPQAFELVHTEGTL